MGNNEGDSPGSKRPEQTPEPRRGDSECTHLQSLSPLRGSLSLLRSRNPGLTPWAIDLRPSGAGRRQAHPSLTPLLAYSMQPILLPTGTAKMGRPLLTSAK